MGMERERIGREILQAIRFGDAPQEEIAKRLKQIVMDEGTQAEESADSELRATLSASLIWKLHAADCEDLQAAAEASRQRFMESCEAKRRRRQVTARLLSAFAAVLVLCAGIAAAALLPDGLFHKESINDGQQYAVVGELQPDQGMLAVQSKNSGQAPGVKMFHAVSLDGLPDFLGREIRLPAQIAGRYQLNEVTAAKTGRQDGCSCSYTDPDTGGRIRIHFDSFQNIEEAHAVYEQDEEGFYTDIGSRNVYVCSNINTIQYIWTEQNTIFAVIFDSEIPDTLEIMEGCIAEIGW